MHRMGVRAKIKNRRMLNKIQIEAIVRLQEGMKNLSPGDYYFEVFDQAIMLALLPNSVRIVDDNYYHNLVKDAKKYHSRNSNRNLPLKTGKFVSIEETDMFSAVPLPLSYQSAEARILFLELQTLLSSEGEKINSLAPLMIELRNDGHNNREIAKIISKSESFVSKFFRKIRPMRVKYVSN